MNKLGLDVIKIKSFSSNKSANLSTSSPNKTIHSKQSLRKLGLHNSFNHKEVLMPVKAKSRSQRDAPNREKNEADFRHLVEMTTSLTNFVTEKEKS
jgi:hypothetical protein